MQFSLSKLSVRFSFYLLLTGPRGICVKSSETGPKATHPPLTRKSNNAEAGIIVYSFSWAITSLDFCFSWEMAFSRDSIKSCS